MRRSEPLEIPAGPTKMWAYPSSSSPPGGQTASGIAGIRLPFIGALRRAHIDVAAWTLWLVVTIIPGLPLVTPIRYLLIGYFSYGVVVNYKVAGPILRKAWPLMLVPALYLLLLPVAFSVTENIRASALFMATALICVFVASKLSTRQIISCLFLIELLAAVMSLILGNHTSHFFAGIFDQKNVLGTHMFVLFATSVAIVADGGLSRLLRVAALAALPIASYMIWLSQSGTALVLAILTFAAFVGYTVIWGPAKSVRHLRSLITLGVAAVASLAALILINHTDVDLLETALGLLGKDSTMTGRTLLWDTADRLIRENPWGFGAEGFWRENIGDAFSLSSRYHESGRFMRFSFHNSYLEMGVTLGYLGMWAMIFVAAWSGFNVLVKWARNPNIHSTFFVVVAASVLMRASVEIDLAGPLTTFSILLYVGALKPHPAPTIQRWAPTVGHGPRNKAPPA